MNKNMRRKSRDVGFAEILADEKRIEEKIYYDEIDWKISKLEYEMCVPKGSLTFLQAMALLSMEDYNDF